MYEIVHQKTKENSHTLPDLKGCILTISISIKPCHEGNFFRQFLVENTIIVAF